MSLLTQLVAELNAGTLKVVDLTQPLGPETPVIGLPPMFASSPGLPGLDHPTYDVWLLDCKASTPEIDFGSAPKTPAPKQLELKHIK